MEQSLPQELCRPLHPPDRRPGTPGSEEEFLAVDSDSGEEAENHLRQTEELIDELRQLVSAGTWHYLAFVNLS